VENWLRINLACSRSNCYFISYKKH
jgi:hypothetical protein